MRLMPQTMMDGKMSWNRLRTAPTTDDWYHELCMHLFDKSVLENTTVVFYRGPFHTGNKVVSDVLHTSSNCWGLRPHGTMAPAATTAETYSLQELGTGAAQLGTTCGSCFFVHETISMARARNPRVGYEVILELVRQQLLVMPGKITRARSANGRIKLRNELLETAGELAKHPTTGVLAEQIDERDRLLGELADLVGQAAEALVSNGSGLQDAAATKIRTELGANGVLLDETVVVGAGTMQALATNVTAKLAVEAYTVKRAGNNVVLRCPAYVWSWLMARERRTYSLVPASSWPDGQHDDEVLGTAASLYDPSSTSALRTIGSALEAASLLHS